MIMELNFHRFFIFFTVLVLIIVCLSRRGKRPPSHPDLDEVVKETIGATDLEAFGEKDIDQYDLSFLRLPPPGATMNGVLARLYYQICI